MASTIITKNGTGSAVPSSLTHGELAINVDHGNLYYGTSGSTAVSSSFIFTDISASNLKVLSGTGSFEKIQVRGVGVIDQRSFIIEQPSAFNLDFREGGASSPALTITSQGGGLQPIIVSSSGNFIINNITSSGIISASGTIIGGGLNINGTTTFNDGNITNVGAINVDAINDDASGGDTNIALTNTTLNIEVGGETLLETTGTTAKFSVPIETTSHITASGNISASGDLYSGDKLYINNKEALEDLGSLLGINEQSDFGGVQINRSNTPKPTILYGNVTASGNISASGNILANTGTGSFGRITADIGLFGTATTTIGDNIDTTGNITASGHISAVDITASGDFVGTDCDLSRDLTVGRDIRLIRNFSSSGNITAFNFIATGSGAAQGNITATGTGSFAHIIGTKIVGALTGDVIGDVTGDLTGEADTVATIAGLAPNTATTQATQGAITSLGTLTGLNVDGNITASGDISASGDVYADRIFSEGERSVEYNGSSILIGNTSTPLILRGSSTNLNQAGGLFVSAGPITASGNIKTGGNLFLSASSGHITASGNISSSGDIRANNFYGYYYQSFPSNATLNSNNTYYYLPLTGQSTAEHVSSNANERIPLTLAFDSHPVKSMIRSTNGTALNNTAVTMSIHFEPPFSHGDFLAQAPSTANPGDTTDGHILYAEVRTVGVALNHSAIVIDWLNPMSGSFNDGVDSAPAGHDIPSGSRITLSFKTDHNASVCYVVDNTFAIDNSNLY